MKIVGSSADNQQKQRIDAEHFFTGDMSAKRLEIWLGRHKSTHKCPQHKLSSLANLILPALRLCKIARVFVDYFKYDSQGVITIVKGATGRKIIVAALLIIQMIGIVAAEFVQEAAYVSNNIKTMSRFVTCTYFFHKGCVFWSLNLSSSTTEQVLRRIQVLEKELLESRGAQLLHPKKSATFCRYMLTGYTIFVVVFWLFTRLSAYDLLTYGCGPWAEKIAGFSLQAARSCFGIQTSYSPAVGSTTWNIAVAMPFALFTLLYDYHWIMGCALTTLWGIAFVKMFRGFVETLDRSADNMLELANGSIGFEALVFFTLTYSLIGSVASLITT